MATPNQEVVLRLDEETMERLVVGVADYLRNTQRGQPGTSTSSSTAEGSSSSTSGK